MKLARDIAKKLFDFVEPERLVHNRQFAGRIIALEEPVMNTAMRCLRCNGTKGLSPLTDPAKGLERTWFCINGECLKLDRIDSKYAKEREPQVRCDYWNDWRNDNGIGDVWIDMDRLVEQRIEMVKAVAAFAKRPSKVLILAGNPGTGKTFCALKIAHYYLRTRSDAIFFTSAMLKEKWMQAMHDGTLLHFMHRLREYGLLIIDDFGQQDATPGFMAMLFDLVNYRLQWTDRGTVLTTNQSPDALMVSVGQAMADRLRGQTWLRFNGASKR